MWPYNGIGEVLSCVCYRCDATAETGYCIMEDDDRQIFTEERTVLQQLHFLRGVLHVVWSKYTVKSFRNALARPYNFFYLKNITKTNMS